MRAVFYLMCAATVCACGAEREGVVQGYVEGDFLFIGPETAGRVEQVAVEEGDSVTADQPLFSLNSQIERARLAGAQAHLLEARARLSNLEHGARPQRLAQLRSQVRSARVELELSRVRLERRSSLPFGTVPAESVDEAEAAVATAEQHLAQAQKELALERLPAREQEIRAALYAAQAAEAEVDRLEEELGRRSVQAPAAGTVHELVRREGEVVQPGTAVVSLLPDDRRRVVFFVPQAAVPALEQGQQVAVLCDGCPPGLSARITYVASEVEFTPPVIYGPEQRDKLVVRVEARPSAKRASLLEPGQPVSVRLPGATGKKDD